jgi:membrane-bound lytic murein transglycosylase
LTAVTVSIADEHDRQCPDHGQVQRLVERADVGGAIAEEAHRDLAGAAVLSRPGGAVGDD